MALKPISVSQLNEYISRVLTTDPLLGNVTVKGEISNIKYHSSGHVYFSISDNDSKLNCFFPCSYVKNLDYELGDGLEVIINGYINVYKKGGTYTLFVRTVTVNGDGNLALAFQLMKEKLEKEGLFDLSHKKSIPKFPKTIGVVTSNTGAAVQDILKIITARNRIVDIIIFPVIVQGNGAGKEIARMIDFINHDDRFKTIDTLIVGRGGGSAEDLWAFNDETLAYSIYNSNIPIISAVGHEIDFSISDFVADLRAETPTAAAEIAVPDQNELEANIEKYKQDLLIELKNKLKYDRLKVDSLCKEITNEIQNKITNLNHLLESFKITIDECNPNNVLLKGYSIIRDNKDNVISSVQDFNSGKYTITFKDGTKEFEI